MSHSALMLWLVATAVVTVVILTVATLAAADLLPRRGEERLDRDR